MVVSSVVHPAPSAPKRQRWQRWLATTLSSIGIVLCALTVISAGGSYLNNEFPAHEETATYGHVAAFVMLTVTALLFWRHRWPIPIAIVAIIATIVMPTSPFVSLTAMAAAVTVTTGARRWILVGAAVIATMASMYWDLAAANSLLSTFVEKAPSGSPERANVVVAVPFLAAILTAPFAMWGISRGYRGERDRARDQTTSATRNVEILHREVERERERQELAREVHDTLAARLSAVSLNAGALELSLGDADDKDRQSARRIRESTQGALDAVRDLVHALKNPDVAHASTGLVSLSNLIDEAEADGADIRAHLMISDPAACDPETAHAVYRVVQESISNARRHAGEVAIRVDVRGGPQSGLSINVANAVVAGHSPTSLGGGNGLTGMSERVFAAGGTFQAGLTQDGSFSVSCWLPWQ